MLVINTKPSILKAIIDSNPKNNVILLDGQTISEKDNYKIDEKELWKNTIR